MRSQGSPELTIGRSRTNKDTTTGTISVSRPLDFETRNMYRLQVVALDMYAEPGKDSRNAAAFEVIVVVEDVQDTPPMFTRLETVVHVRNNMSVVSTRRPSFPSSRLPVRTVSVTPSPFPFSRVGYRRFGIAANTAIDRVFFAQGFGMMFTRRNEQKNASNWWLCCSTVVNR